MLHILIIDDQEAGRLLARYCLEELGFNDLHEATGGEEALKYLARTWKDGKPVQLILCDYNMPGVTGFQFFRVLQKTEEFKNVPLLVVSAQQDYNLVREMAMQGIEHYITKPITTPVLRKKLTEIFG